MCFGRASRLVKSGFYLLVIGAGFEPASEVTTHRPRFTSPILPIWGDACKRLPIPPPYRLHPVETTQAINPGVLTAALLMRLPNVFFVPPHPLPPYLPE